MTILKRRQIVILTLVLMIVIAGYIQYSYKKSGYSENDEETGRLGEAVYVDTQELESAKGDNQETNKDESEEKGKIVTASKEAEDYFAQTKLEKEITRSRDADSFRSIAEDEKASAEVKEQAYNKMMALIDVSDKEMRIEALIKKQGFDDVIALFADDGSVDIIVKAPTLTASQVAQITDIVSRQANVDIDKIIIKNKF
ncbi:MAG: SpoIIIAH-like family protein [Firmicutes bacterium]|nr:SpoIIIAH-like family protein [Bacillota bacterium]